MASPVLNCCMIRLRPLDYLSGYITDFHQFRRRGRGQSLRSLTFSRSPCLSSSSSTTLSGVYFPLLLDVATYRNFEPLVFPLTSVQRDVAWTSRLLSEAMDLTRLAWAEGYAYFRHDPHLSRHRNGSSLLETCSPTVSVLYRL